MPVGRQIYDMLSRLARDESGQDVVEYGLIVATIAVVVLIGTMAFGNQIRPWFEHLAGMITTTGTGS
jgi:Flp pilus assembly pilin Flp